MSGNVRSTVGTYTEYTHSAFAVSRLGQPLLDIQMPFLSIIPKANVKFVMA